ncbi:sulfurtransferase [Roseateles koreensis]|uniref:Sulfurtransferase n=1 Tax=Roseateles koreensis TaxID=2987526 RepID=A0ABT5KTX3_9BURK|nr:sulfurtransferase [Roseateles koreensis]MDC8786271.1 sulfurtransferase [Roseateles koreensis]
MPSSHQALISAAELKGLLAQGQAPLLIDVSFDLGETDAGERAYRAAHLPGAHYLHLDRDLSGAKTGRNGRHPLPAPEAWARCLSNLGVRAGQQVVAYDAQGGMYAARLWWLLRWVGHAEVAVLDGGLQAWVAAGGAVADTVSPAANPSVFQTGPSLVAQIDADHLQAQLGRVRLIDARAPERFRGDVEPLDAKAGHIPGASNRLFKNNLQADGTFKPAARLREEFLSLLGPFSAEQTVHQCGSGVTACHNLLAMMHAGLPGAQLYPGSWSEWSSTPGRPLAQG